MKNIFFMIAAILVMIYMFISIRKNKLDVTQSFIWIAFCILMLILSIWPHAIDVLAPIFGVSYAPILVLTIACVVLFIMNFINSKKIEELHKKVIDLGQELSVIKEEVNEKKK